MRERERVVVVVGVGLACLFYRLRLFYLLSIEGALGGGNIYKSKRSVTICFVLDVHNM